MIGSIVVVLASVVVLYGVSKVFSKVEAVVKRGVENPTVVKATETVANATATAVRKTTKSSPRVIAAIVTPVVAFTLFAACVSITAPPQADFTVGNVAWDSRDGGVLGATSDAVLVRTTGATVNKGFLYSTATLSGVEYVSFGGMPWVAVGGEGAGTVVGMMWVGVLALLSGALAYVGLNTDMGKKITTIGAPATAG